MIADANKGIASISYNLLNLPVLVVKANDDWVQYTYDAAGIKLKKEASISGNVTTTDYVGGKHYINNSLSFFSSGVGRIVKSGNDFNYEYNLSDHLGNVRVSMNDGRGANMVDNSKAESTVGYSPNKSTFVTREIIGDQDYIKAVSAQNGSTPGIYPIDGEHSVSAGKRYLLQIRGFQGNSGKAHLYVKNTTGGNLVWLDTQLPIGAENEGWISREFTIPSGGTSVKVGILWNSPEIGNYFYINEIRLVEISEPAVIQRDDYYPFGLTFQSYTGTNPKNDYKYNGNEVQEELPNLSDFNARFYDPSLGRFINVDPLAGHPNQMNQSSYQFGWNNPVNLNDPSGLNPCPTCFTELELQFKSWWNDLTGATQRLASENSSGLSEDDPVPTSYRKQRQSIGKLNDATTVVESGVEAVELVAEGVNSIPGVEIVGDPLLAAYYGLKGDAISSSSYAAGIFVPGLSGAFIKRGSGVIRQGLKRVDDLPCGCFTENTKVLTDKGSIDISQIEIGDLVYAYDDKTGNTGLKEVVNVFTKKRDHIYRIYFDGNVIEATNDHPFYIGGRWLKVETLSVGDRMNLYSGDKVVIDSITYEKGIFKVYNFEVDDYHTYYVSDKNVLVHNSGPCDFLNVNSIRKWEVKYGDDAISKIDRIRKSIRTSGVGSIEPIQVFRFNGKNLLVDGHHRLAAAIEEGVGNIPIRFLSQEQFNSAAKRMGRFSSPEALEAISERLINKANVIR